MNNRDNCLDFIRGLAIIMMIIFHLIYDLNYFGFTNIDLHGNPLTQYWRYLIIILFLSAVGISMVIVYKEKFNIYKFSKRILLIGSCAFTISIVTYFIFPKSWVYFGILHLILVSSIITIFFVRMPKISLLIAIIILTAYYFDLINLSFLATILKDKIPQYSVDFYPIFPWIAFVFIGIYMGHNPWYRKIFIIKSNIIQNIGKKSLIIYMLHQPILWVIIYITHRIIKLI